MNRWATAIRNRTVAKSTVSRTYLFATSRASVPRSKNEDALAFSRAAFLRCGLWNPGMCPGPGGAAGFENGSVCSQSSNAER